MKTRNSLLILIVPLLLLFPHVLVAQDTTTAVVLAVDTSGSMEGESLALVEEAIQNALEANSSSVPIALIGFNEQPVILADFTTDPTQLMEAFTSIEPAGNTAMYDAMLGAIELAATIDATQRTVIFLTDGTNSGSQSTQQASTNLAITEGVTVHTIALGPDANRNYLMEMAEVTGGAFYSANGFNLAEVYGDLASAWQPTSLQVAGNQSSITLVNDENSRIVTAGTSGNVEGPVVQPIERTTTSNGATPTNLVVALDITGSMTPEIMADVRDALQILVEETEESVPVSLLAFNETSEVIQDFTTDFETLATAFDGIVPMGNTSLYDATFAAIRHGLDSGTEQPVVLLLTDGADSTSEILPEGVISLATTNDVRIDTIALGAEADLIYLQQVAQATGGTFSAMADSTQLESIFRQQATNLLALYREAQPSIVEQVADGTFDPSVFGFNVPVTVPDTIAPLNGELLDLEIEPTPLTGEVAASVSDPQAEESDGTISPDALNAEAVQPVVSGFVPIRISIPDDTRFEVAELSLNSVLLGVYDEPPYTYDLNENTLRRGLYRLTFSAVNERDVVFRDTLEFEIDLASDGSRTILINEEPGTLDLAFTQEEGLAIFISAEEAAELAESQSLGDILMRPFENIPLPVKDAVTQQRPGLVTAIIIIMTLILLPQGMFTIYWMTYTWVYPQRVEKSGAPKRDEWAEPMHSFTALLPARKEDSVIYDTIMTVNAIEYPEELKEILILIRDEDDDETINETLRAIEDIQWQYAGRGEDYPDNIHLITFKDGPKNKPNGLNRGYLASTKDVICIFDAEDAPHKDIYSVINTVMQRDNADVVQSGVQLMNYKSTWFSSFNVLEYFFWFKSGLHAYTHGLKVTPLGGNTVFFKKYWLDRLAEQDLERGYRAWDEGTLTEDADVGIRLTSMGASIQVVYEAELATQEETPHNIEQFIKQRTRWCQGFYEIFMKGDWLRLPTLKQRIAGLYILLNSLLQAAILIFLPIGLYIAMTQQVSVPITLLSYLPIYLMITQMIITLVGMKEFADAYGERLPMGFRFKMMLFYYPYQLLLSISAMRAIFRFLTNQSAWEKTAHSNLHRQSSTAGA